MISVSFYPSFWWRRTRHWSSALVPKKEESNSRRVVPSTVPPRGPPIFLCGPRHQSDAKQKRTYFFSELQKCEQDCSSCAIDHEDMDSDERQKKPRIMTERYLAAPLLRLKIGTFFGSCKPSRLPLSTWAAEEYNRLAQVRGWWVLTTSDRLVPFWAVAYIVVSTGIISCGHALRKTPQYLPLRQQSCE